MHKPAFVEENDEIIWDFELQTEHPITARRINLEIINKKKMVIWWIR